MMKLEKYKNLNTAEPDRSIEPEDELEHNALTEDEESGLMIFRSIDSSFTYSFTSLPYSYPKFDLNERN
jgi:hypothetical protein